VNDALNSTGYKATGIDLMSCYMLKDENNKKLVYARLKTISEFNNWISRGRYIPLTFETPKSFLSQKKNRPSQNLAT